jgi:hypothetical protein
MTDITANNFPLPAPTQLIAASQISIEKLHKDIDDLSSEINDCEKLFSDKFKKEDFYKTGKKFLEKGIIKLNVNQ